MNIFTKDCLQIEVRRYTPRDDTKTILGLRIESDYSGYAHKQRLYINENRLAEELERLWKSVKTKKLLRMGVHFTEVDYYDNEVDVYYTPSVRIGRGLRKAKIDEDSHGAIPKDWTSHLYAKFEETSTIGPLIEVLKKTLGALFTPAIEKEFTKAVRPVLQKKKDTAHYYNQQEDED